MTAGPKEKIHRPFRLVTPRMDGPDVRIFQEALNDVARDKELRYRVDIDGDLSKRTVRNAYRGAFALGARPELLDDIKKRDRVDEHVQLIVRHPERRSGDEMDRAKKRMKEIRDQHDREDDGAQRTVAWVRGKLGTTESPPGSNLGPEISAWQRYTGYDPPVFWCGCFVCYAVVNIGGANIPVRVRLGFNEYIVSDARNGINGLDDVSVFDARPGDIVTYDFPHIGLIVGPTVNGLVHTIEGNTSPQDGGGSQSNGGGVFERRRPVSDVAVIARPAYG